METYSEYLEHHGVKGMRWGVRRTPAQLGHEKKQIKKKRFIISKDGRKIPVKNVMHDTIVDYKPIKKISQAEENKKVNDEKKAAKKAQKEIARREKILNDPTLLYKHRKEFSPEEIKKAMSNIQMEQNLQQLSVNQLSAGAAYINSALKYADAGIKAYNNAAKIYNAFGKGGKPMPIIGGGDKKKKKKDDGD